MYIENTYFSKLKNPNFDKKFHIYVIARVCCFNTYLSKRELAFITLCNELCGTS